jgi:hypothetical protein
MCGSNMVHEKVVYGINNGLAGEGHINAWRGGGVKFEKLDH